MNEISSSNNVERVAAYQAEVNSQFATVPSEIVKMIFSYLSGDFESAASAAHVCHRWKIIIQLKDKETLEKYGAFGAAEWGQYLGEVGKGPRIPRGIFAWLDGTSVKTEGPGEKNGETGLFFLMPAKVNGEELCLDALRKLTQKATGAWPTEYRGYSDRVRKHYGENPVVTSYWVWMSKTLLLDSRGKSYDKQKSMVNALGNGHKLPEALEAVVLNIVWYASHNGEKLFSDNPATYTRCQRVISGRMPLIVGGFGLKGPRINYALPCDDGPYAGVAACRKFRPLGFGT